MAIQKIMVTSGVLTDTGKSTVAEHLKTYLEAQGRLVEWVGVEASDKALCGEDRRITPDPDVIGELVTDMALLDDDQVLIVDVGGEFFDPMMDANKSFGGGVEQEFDLFVMPISPNHKSEGIIRAVNGLADRGIDLERLVIVFNRILPSRAEKVSEDFSVLLQYAGERGIRVCSHAIQSSDVVARQRGVGSVYEIAGDAKEIQSRIAEAKAAGDIALARDLASRRTIAMRANLDATSFNSVFSEVLAD